MIISIARSSFRDLMFRLANVSFVSRSRRKIVKKKHRMFFFLLGITVKRYIAPLCYQNIIFNMAFSEIFYII